MSEWIKCSEQLPKEDDLCWINTSEGVGEGTFEKNCNRYRLNEKKTDFIKTIEDGFRLDPEYIAYAYLDVVTHWMPYYTPEPPND